MTTGVYLEADTAIFPVLKEHSSALLGAVGMVITSKTNQLKPFKICSYKSVCSKKNRKPRL